MRIYPFPWLSAGALLMAGTACQTAGRPAALLAANQAHPPALVAAAAPETQSAGETLKAAAPAQAQPVPKPDPVAELIARVEKEYQAGQDNYKAGHLEAAKQNFDHAFDMLLSGPVDVRADDRLQNEFDRLLDGVNGMELAALEQGDGFTEQKSEPAPIDEANEVTFPVDPNIKAKAEAEVKETHSDLPLMLTDPVASYINYFSTRGRGVLERALVRSGRYQDMIHRVLREEGVPQDLIYLAQAESGFHPLALSRAGARGMWQFMGDRAKGYGLERDWWVDDRQDPEKSTRAAARHLKDLYNQFGDWYLAMAAYNSGPGTVQQAVKRTGYADFWELYRRNVLPRETRNYVPIIVAVTIMAKNRSQYGLADIVADQPVVYDTVKINYPVDLRLVAECVDASASDLQDLNPGLLRFTTPKDQEFELHVPAGTSGRYSAAISAIPEDMRVWWRFHKVTPGESLALIARAYHTTPQAISDANNLQDEALQPESKLIIPVAPGKRPAGEEVQSYSRMITRYKVRQGDTVERVAENFGVSPAMVRRWNHLKGNSVKGRRIVYIHLPVTPNASETSYAASPKSKSKKHLSSAGKSTAARHKVQPGETLTSIASTHHTTVAALKRDNGNLAVLRPGMILVIRP